jgi:hypothetical protein
MISRLPGVYAVQTTGATTASAYRSPLIPAVNTNALTVDAATLDLTAAAETSLAQGRFLNAATQNEPVCVLGAAAQLRHRPNLPRRGGLGPAPRGCMSPDPRPGRAGPRHRRVRPSPGHRQRS